MQFVILFFFFICLYLLRLLFFQYVTRLPYNTNFDFFKYLVKLALVVADLDLTLRTVVVHLIDSVAFPTSPSRLKLGLLLLFFFMHFVFSSGSG